MRRPAFYQHQQAPDQVAEPAAPQHAPQSVRGRGKVPKVSANVQREARVVAARAGRPAGDVREGMDKEERQLVQAARLADRGTGVK